SYQESPARMVGVLRAVVAAICLPDNPTWRNSQRQNFWRPSPQLRQAYRCNRNGFSLQSFHPALQLKARSIK
ncbi:unnamed protein product, partial [Nesidiocoris tenuis]